MDAQQRSLLKELERFGAENDARVTTRRERMLNITPDTGPFLALLIQATKARRVLELGMSNGYSTLWLADAVARLEGRVTTVEVLPEKAEMARTNFARGGLSSRIDLRLGDGGDFLKTQSPACYDFVFLDSDRDQYVVWWPDLQRVLTPGGLMVVDNAVSHAHEMETFVGLIHATPGYMTSLVPLGNGEFLVLKEGR